MTDNPKGATPAEIAAREDAGGNAIDWTDPANLSATAAQRAAFRRGWHAALATPAAAAEIAQPAAPEPRAWHFDGVPPAGSTCLVWARSSFAKGPYYTVDNYGEQHEAPVAFSSATIPVGEGWDTFDHDDVIAWMLLDEAGPVATQAQPATHAEVLQALDWIDDFIARCNGDDRGACEPVNIVRAAIATQAAQTQQPKDVGVSPSGPGSVVASLPSIPDAAGHDLRDGDPVDDVIPTLPAGHVWCCGNGCGDCRAILVPFEYSRTETVDGELLESRSVMRAASHCCKAPLMIWDDANDKEGPEPDFRASDRVRSTETERLGPEGEERGAEGMRPEEIEREASAPQVVEPIPMLLHCPKCFTQHIDGPEWINAGPDERGRRTPSAYTWTNPPHRSHLCHHCGCIWRPADVPTTGVKGIATKGKADTWDQGFADSADAQLSTLPGPARCIKPHCPPDCSGCAHAIPSNSEALVLIADMLDTFAVDGFDAPFEDGESVIVDRARAFLRDAAPSTKRLVKVGSGDDLHLTLLMAPHGLNFVTGPDRARLLAYARDVWDTALQASAPSVQVVPADVGNALARLAAYLDAAAREGNPDEQAMSRAVRRLVSQVEEAIAQASALPAAQQPATPEDRAIYSAIAAGYFRDTQPAAAQPACPSEREQYDRIINEAWMALPREVRERHAGDATEYHPLIAACKALAAPAAQPAAQPKSLLRLPSERPTVCYCPPGKCRAPAGFNGPCNRATDG